MENLQKILSAVTAFVRVKYLPAAMAAGIPKREFKEWAHSMANLGVATALEKFEEEFDEEEGSLLGYAIFRTKDAVRSSLREEHRYRKAVKALTLVPTNHSGCGGIRFYLSRTEAEEIMGLLSADQQRVLSLNYAGYSVNEIATRMKLKSINTVKSLLRRARKNSYELFMTRNQHRSFPNPEAKGPHKPRDENNDLQMRSR